MCMFKHTRGNTNFHTYMFKHYVYMSYRHMLCVKECLHTYTLKVVSKHTVCTLCRHTLPVCVNHTVCVSSVFKNTFKHVCTPPTQCVHCAGVYTLLLKLHIYVSLKYMYYWHTLLNTKYGRCLNAQTHSWQPKEQHTNQIVHRLDF